MSTIPGIPEDIVESHKGYYVCVYVLLQFKTEDKIDNTEEQTELENDPDEEDEYEINIDDERERHWRNIFEDNEGGVDDKEFLHAKRWDLYLNNKEKLVKGKRWDLYLNNKEKLVKGKYSVEVVGHDKKKVLWEVVGDHVVEDPSDHEDIGLREFDFNIFDEDGEGVVMEECSGPYLKMLIKVWPGYWIDQLKRMNQKADEENGKQLVKGNVWHRKFRRFSSCEFWKNIGCLISASTFGIGVLRLWEK